METAEGASNATLSEAIRDFSSSLSALRDFVALIGPFLEEHSREVEELRTPHLEVITAAIKRAQSEEDGASVEDVGQSLNATKQDENHSSEETSPDEKSISIRLTKSEVTTLWNALDELSKSRFQEELLYKSTLMSLISSAEWFLSQLLHHYFQRFPEVTGPHTKLLSLEDLKSFGSVDDAIRFLVDSKVDEIMRGSLVEWVKFFKETMKLGMGYIDGVKVELVEIYQRRNLLVHNGGRVNSIYMSKVDAKLIGEMAIGDSIPVSREYLEGAINVFELNFILIAAELWKKLDPFDNERGSILVTTAFKHIQNERYEVAIGLSYFIMNDKQLPEKDRMISQMNYWQAKKWSSEFDEVRTEVEEVDLTAKSIDFQLARFALLDSYPEFFQMLPSALASKALTY